MNETGDKSKWGGLATIGIVVLLAAYVGGYFMLSKKPLFAPRAARQFGSEIVATVYWPLGWVESKVRRKRVLFMGPMIEEAPGRFLTDVLYDFDP